MTDKPIPFRPDMAQAAHIGAKTNTRRVVGRLRRFGQVTEFGRSDTPGFDWHFRDKAKRWHDLTHAELLAALPYQINDRLWVKEPWRTWSSMDHRPPRNVPNIATIRYEADHSTTSGVTMGVPGRYRHARFMPRWASRTTLLVTDVQVQRLQDISNSDAGAEGVDFRAGYHDELVFKNYGRGMDFAGSNAERMSFATLWESIHGEGAWDRNDWVQVIQFERVPK